MSLSGHGKLAGVMGWPIGHSLSPALHGYWLREHNIDGAYIPLAVARENFANVLHGLRDSGFVGVNITIPHKESAYAVAHEVDDAALISGSVNVLVFRDGRIVGYNTDTEGLVASLAEALGAKALQGRPAVVLGSGGAARSAILACDQLRASAVRVVCRNPARGEALIGGLKARTRASLSAIGWDAAGDAMSGAGLLVNATPAGMKGNAAVDLSLQSLPADAAVCDIVYNPIDTDLLKRARQAGHRTVDGLGMLMHQAIPVFELYYGTRPKVTAALRRTLEEALGHAG